MVAYISAVGGEVRLVRTIGQVYPELVVGGDARLERAAHLIRKVLLVKTLGDSPLYRHTDADGWHRVNLHHTHPGGELMDERSSVFWSPEHCSSRMMGTFVGLR